jgi:hypothetical protein
LHRFRYGGGDYYIQIFNIFHIYDHKGKLPYKDTTNKLLGVYIILTYDVILYNQKYYFTIYTIQIRLNILHLITIIINVKIKIIQQIIAQ